MGQRPCVGTTRDRVCGSHSRPVAPRLTSLGGAGEGPGGNQDSCPRFHSGHRAQGTVAGVPAGYHLVALFWASWPVSLNVSFPN